MQQNFNEFWRNYIEIAEWSSSNNPMIIPNLNSESVHLERRYPGKAEVGLLISCSDILDI